MNRLIPVAVASMLAAPLSAQQPQVVQSNGPGSWGASVRLVEELRIGVAEGADEYTFGRIGGLAVGKAGAIFVADAQGPRVRMYDAQGKFVRNVGRTGSGPGEYNAFGGIRAFPDGRVALWDNRNRRIVVYAPNGDFSTSHTVQSGLFSADVFQVDRDGRFYVRATTHIPEDGGEWQFGWIRVAPNGQIIDTLRVPADPKRPESFSVGGDRPFTHELLTAMSSLGYLVTGHNSSYAFELHRPIESRDRPASRLTSTLRIERAFTPLRVGREERSEWEAWATHFERSAANPTSSNPRVVLPEPRKVEYTIPEIKPAYKDIRTDSEGRIWVKRYVEAQKIPVATPNPNRPPRSWRELPTFDVFEPGGRFLGTVSLPMNATFLDAVGTKVYGTARGEFDEQYVVRWRIEPLQR